MLGFDSECSVETGRRILPGDLGSQFDQLFVVELLGDASEADLIDVAGCHRVGVTQGSQCSLIEQIHNTRATRRECSGGGLGDAHQLLVRDSVLAAHGSVDVLSKHTADERCDAPVDQRRQPSFEQA